MNKLEFVKKHQKSVGILCAVWNSMFFNKSKLSTDLDSCILMRCKTAVSGKNNKLKVGKLTVIKDGCIRIYGNNNTVIIGDKCSLKGIEIWIEDDNNTIIIGDNTTCENDFHLACIEGKSITLGNDCMVSSNVTLRVGDSHSILDKDNKRINASRSIKLGNHIWVGNESKILKGVSIADNSIVGTGSIVTKSFDTEGCVIAGNPAKIIKTDINWDRQRINIE